MFDFFKRLFNVKKYSLINKRGKVVAESNNLLGLHYYAKYGYTASKGINLPLTYVGKGLYCIQGLEDYVVLCCNYSSLRKQFRKALEGLENE